MTPESFVALNANCPYPRKGVDVSIDGFAEFASIAEGSVFLYLHHPCADVEIKEQVKRRVRDHGLEDIILINTLPGTQSMLHDSELNLLYNACDVGINTAMGEGWGLASMEHAATAAPQIVPKHTVFCEVWGRDALFVETDGTWYTDRYERCTMQPVSPRDLARRLLELYTDKTLYDKMSRAALRRARSKSKSWSYAVTMMKKILEEA